jgi:predicted nucleic-acid-binding Zn-ribbon protein
MVEQSGKLTVQDMKTVQDWIAHIGLPAGLGCPLCGESSWTVGESLFQPLAVAATGSTLGTAHIMMTSKKCGYTFFLNATIVGLMRP